MHILMDAAVTQTCASESICLLLTNERVSAQPLSDIFQSPDHPGAGVILQTLPPTDIFLAFFWKFHLVKSSFLWSFSITLQRYFALLISFLLEKGSKDHYIACVVKHYTG